MVSHHQSNGVISFQLAKPSKQLWVAFRTSFERRGSGGTFSSIAFMVYVPGISCLSRKWRIAVIASSSFGVPLITLSL